MPITATFSNGHVDVYKGKRPVKAAWMITRKSDGKVLNSGHSLDVDKARKTAEGNAAYCGTAVLGEDGHKRFPGYFVPAKIAHFNGTRAEYAQQKECNARRNAAIRAGIVIEVIAL